MPGQSNIISRNLEAARRFYTATAGPLGLTVMDDPEGGFVVGGAATGAVIRVQPAGAEGPLDDRAEARPAYVAIEAPNDFTVRAFYRAALEAGGQEHLLGYPAPRSVAEAGLGYYAARVADPDGNCIECGWRH